jgi:predicted  nucleic acid-binding Zn-ribbon protein
MFWPKSNELPQYDDSALRARLDDLRSDFVHLRTMVRAQETAVATLQNERVLRESELADLRTRMEVVIKRIGARLERVNRPTDDLENAMTLVRSKRR